MSPKPSPHARHFEGVVRVDFFGLGFGEGHEFLSVGGDNPSFEESARTALVARSKAVYVPEMLVAPLEGLDWSSRFGCRWPR